MVMVITFFFQQVRYKTPVKSTQGKGISAFSCQWPSDIEERFRAIAIP
jgi:hypothetical protein